MLCYLWSLTRRCFTQHGKIWKDFWVQTSPGCYAKDVSIRQSLRAIPSRGRGADGMSAWLRRLLPRSYPDSGTLAAQIWRSTVQWWRSGSPLLFATSGPRFISLLLDLHVAVSVADLRWFLLCCSDVLVTSLLDTSPLKGQNRLDTFNQRGQQHTAFHSFNQCNNIY